MKSKKELTVGLFRKNDHNTIENYLQMYSSNFTSNLPNSPNTFFKDNQSTFSDQSPSKEKQHQSESVSEESLVNQPEVLVLHNPEDIISLLDRKEVIEESQKQTIKGLWHIEEMIQESRDQKIAKRLVRDRARELQGLSKQSSSKAELRDKISEMRENPSHFFNFGFNLEEYSAFLVKMMFTRTMLTFIRQARVERFAQDKAKIQQQQKKYLLSRSNLQNWRTFRWQE